MTLSLVHRCPLLVAAALLAAAGAGYAAADDKGRSQTAASYLWIGPSARSTGLGNAFTAVADDADGAWYNPAGIAQSRRHEMAFASALLGLGRSYHFANYSYSFGLPQQNESSYWSSRWNPSGSVFTPPEVRVIGVGLTWIGFGVGGIEARDEFGNPAGALDDSENAYIVTLGYNQYEDLFIGLNARLLTQKLADAQAAGYGLDLGGLYRHPSRRLSLGLALRNVLGSLAWKVPNDILRINDEYSEPVAMNARLGAAYALSNALLLLLDLDYTVRQTLGYHAGAEYRPAPPFALRLGMDGANPSFGFGFDARRSGVAFALDYAFLIDTDALGNQQRFSLSARFGATEEPTKSAPARAKKKKTAGKPARRSLPGK